MGNENKPKRREKLKRFGHFFSGMLILLHAYERHEHGHGTWSLFATAGLIFFSVALFHSPLVRKWPWVDGLFFAIEAGLSFTIMGEFVQAGKKGLPFMYLIAGAFQSCAAYWAARKGIRSGVH